MNELNDKSEAELIVALQQGDISAFDEIFERHRRRILAYVRGLVMDKSSAEDITQETFVKLVRRIGSIKPEKGVSSWLYRVARNASVDYLRKRDKEVVSDTAGLRTEVWNDPAVGIQNYELDRQLANAMAGLNVEDRNLMALRYFADLSFREIAGIMRRPLGTVLWRNRRALERLRRLMDKDGKR